MKYRPAKIGTLSKISSMLFLSSAIKPVKRYVKLIRKRKKKIATGSELKVAGWVRLFVNRRDVGSNHARRDSICSLFYKFNIHDVVKFVNNCKQERVSL